MVLLAFVNEFTQVGVNFWTSFISLALNICIIDVVNIICDKFKPYYCHIKSYFSLLMHAR